MGGKRIAEQVRRALIAAAKVAPVAVVIDASGCTGTDCMAYALPPPTPTLIGAGGTAADANPDAWPRPLFPRPAEDSGSADSGAHDASKDGG